MNIIVLMGSPNRNGSTSILVSEFVKGAEEAGHIAYNSSLNSRHLRSALLTVAWNADDWTFEALVAHYKTLVRYINFEDKGMVLGYGCGTPAMTKRSIYPEKAYELGRNLR